MTRRYTRKTASIATQDTHSERHKMEIKLTHQHRLNTYTGERQSVAYVTFTQPDRLADRVRREGKNKGQSDDPTD